MEHGAFPGMPEPVPRSTSKASSGDGYLQVDETEEPQGASAFRRKQSVGYDSLNFDAEGNASAPGGPRRSVSANYSSLASSGKDADHSYQSMDYSKITAAAPPAGLKSAKKSAAKPTPAPVAEEAYLDFDQDQPVTREGEAETAIDQAYLDFDQEPTSSAAKPVKNKHAGAAPALPGAVDESYLSFEGEGDQPPSGLAPPPPADESYLDFEAPAAGHHPAAAPEESYLDFDAPAASKSKGQATSKARDEAADASYLTLHEDEDSKGKKKSKDKKSKKKGRTPDTDDAYLDMVLGLGAPTEEPEEPPPPPPIQETAMDADDGDGYLEFDAEQMLREAGADNSYFAFDAQEALRQAGLADDDGDVADTPM